MIMRINLNYKMGLRMTDHIKAEGALSRDIRSLRYVEHFLAWALRTSVACSPQCRTLQREFIHAFGAEPSAGIQAFHSWLMALSQGQRRLEIGRPGLIELTRDEEALLALLASAQAGDRDRFLAQARWLMGTEPDAGLYAAGQGLMALLNGRGYQIALARLTPVTPCRSAPVVLKAV